jgi:isopentenyl-diphosphate delta-isomerase type 1
MEELVVLVDENNNPVGTAPKATVHTTDTPLHRAFSLFLFNSQKQLLLTKRAETKKTFAGVWTNTVCGHLAPNETPIESAKRRLEQELGMKNDEVRGLTEAAPYRYRFSDKNGIVENEICPILIGHTDSDPIPSPSEVDDWKWMDWEDFLQEISANADIYSPWSREEALILQQKDLV